MNPTAPDYHQLLTAVKQRVREAQYQPCGKSINSKSSSNRTWANSLPSASNSTAGAKA